MDKTAITIISAVLLVGIAFALLAVKIIMVKGGRFPSGHVADIPALRKKGITCARQNSKTKVAH